MTFDDLPLIIQQVALERWPQIDRDATRVLHLDWTHRDSQVKVSPPPGPDPVRAPPVPIAANQPSSRAEVVDMDRYASPWPLITFWLGYAPRSNVLVVKY